MTSMTRQPSFDLSISSSLPGANHPRSNASGRAIGRLAAGLRLQTAMILGFLLTLVLATGTGEVLAQTVSQFPGIVPVAGTPATQTVKVTMLKAGTVAAVRTLTQGSASLDFTQISGGTCTANSPYAIADQCTVNVSFSPKFPGLRQGAVVLTQTDGTALGTSFLTGYGSGPLSVITPGHLDTVAGDAGWLYDFDNVPATQSSLFLPQGVVTDAAGNMYISDTNNNRIRRVDAATQLITTLAGGEFPGYSGDNGPGTASTLNGPTALAIDGAGNLFIADSGNFVVRMLNTISGVITTVAGGGQGALGDGGPARSATLATVKGLAIDAQHNLLIADSGNNCIRRVNLATGIISRFAGSGQQGTDGDHGPALAAQFAYPSGINFGQDGSLYIADLGNNRIRKVAPDGTATTVAGGGGTYIGDGGLATDAGLNLPAGVVVDQANNLFIADAGWNSIRKVTASTGIITTIAGNMAEQLQGDGGNADKSEWYGPYAIYYDGQGNLFIADMFHNRIRKIDGNLASYIYDPIRVNRTSPPNPELVENDGNADLSLVTPALVNASLDPATTTCTWPQTLNTGKSCVMGIAFSPTTVATNVLGSVSLTSASGNSPAVINLSGQVLSVDPTAITVTSSLNPSGLGTSVTFTAHVTTQGSSFSGTVQFLDGTTPLGAPALKATGASGTAAVTVSTLTLGQHNITAVYSGDATNNTSTSPILVQSVKQDTTTVLASSANPSLESAPVTLTATVAASGSTPTGTFTFIDGGVTLGTGTINASGSASLTVSTLTIGTHLLTASYSGDTNNGPSISNTVPQVVQGQGSTTTLGTSNATIPVGSSVTFSVQVHGSSTAVASGSVTFKDGGNAIGTALLNSASAVTFSTTGLTPGLHTITAVYAGDASYAGSTSAPLVETVQQIATATAVSASVNPAPAGAPVVLTAAITATTSNPTGGTISGTVTFMNGGVVLGTGSVSASGLATLSIASIPLGGNNISAVYAGNPNYSGSTSAPIVVTVKQATSATTLASNQNPSTVEDNISLTATVTTNGGKATGVVTFNDGGTSIGQATLNANGVASITVSSLLVGQHGLIASYAGDTQNLGSSSPAFNQTVILRPSTDVLTSSATSLNGGQQITMISVVGWTGSIVPTGTVTFQSAGTTLGAAAIDASGVATLTINPQTGLTSVSSTYSGDSVFATSSSAVISLTVGQPPQFTLAASSTALTMQSLQHGTVVLTAASVKGFSDKLALGCLGLPVAATCTFTSDWMMLAADGSNSVNVVVDTGSPLTAGSVANTAKNDTHSSTMIALCGLPAGAFLCLLFWKGRRLRNFGGLLLMLCALGAAVGLSGCGSITTNGTPAGTYHFQITASATGSGVIQAVNMTLTVSK
ncbi:Ig-like domain repeat protein [Granulicella arctica]|uniref:Ig-like domain repeat protein n=1 Tax=Granulicella arctica TaxID=940613 RepID=UPI0021E08130|nr:Ig-like domain repeat protein [Granulicella arctica]